MATTIGESAEQSESLLTVPTAEVWRAMAPAERIAFQLRVVELLSEQRRTRVRQAEVRAEQAEAQARQAEAQAGTRAVLIVLRARGINASAVERDRILAEKDAMRIERWLEKAVGAASLAEVLDDPS
jgi:hypothetical protein